MSRILKTIAIASLALAATTPLRAQDKPETTQSSDNTFSQHPGYYVEPEYRAALSGANLFGRIVAPTAQSFQNDMEKRVEALYNKCAALEAQLSKADKDYRAGMAPADTIQGLKLEYTAVFSEYERAKSQLEWVKKLNKPVSFECSGSSLTEAANALAKATGTRLYTEENLKSDVRLKMATTRLPLYKVLEAIAAQGDVTIDRAANDIVLRRWPAIEINGVKQTFDKPSPWSSAWDEFPFLTSEGAPYGQAQTFYQKLSNVSSARGLTSQRTQTLSDYVTAQNAARPLYNSPTMRSQTLSSLMGRQNSPQSALNARSQYAAGFNASQPTGVIVSLRGSDEIVLTEPANYKGKTGYWITIYRANGKSMSLVQKSFVVSTRSHPQ